MSRCRTIRGGLISNPPRRRTGPKPHAPTRLDALCANGHRESARGLFQSVVVQDDPAQVDLVAAAFLILLPSFAATFPLFALPVRPGFALFSVFFIVSPYVAAKNL